MQIDIPDFARFKENPDEIIPALAKFCEDVKNTFEQAVHPGDVFMVHVSNPLIGALLCDNAEYNQTKFPELYKAIGQDFGGSTGTFRVPGGVHLPTIPSAEYTWAIRV